MILVSWSFEPSPQSIKIIISGLDEDDDNNYITHDNNSNGWYHNVYREEK